LVEWLRRGSAKLTTLVQFQYGAPNFKMKYYKIRDKKTGLFKGPGDFPSWSTTGKVWNQRTIRSAMNISSYSNKQWKNWEVVEYEMNETGVFDAETFYERKT
jgi:hypothetical protein